MSNEPQKWIELAVEAEPEAVEAITELFARYGYNQGVVIEEPVKPEPDGGVLIDKTAPVKIRTFLPVETESSQLSNTEEDASPEVDGLNQGQRIQKLKEGLHYLGMMRKIGPLVVNESREEDWANAWKQYYQVHRVGNRSIIKPPWQQYEAAPGDVIIEIDPGMAFGTGLHPTTRLCITLMEDYINSEKHKNLLDLGTGSGILAIGAARLGVAKVIAVDTDPVATKSARENVERNGLASQVTVETGSLAVEITGPSEGSFYTFSEESQKQPPSLSNSLPFDLIIANIIARIIVALAGPLNRSLKPGGILITSGIISERALEVETSLSKAGFNLLERREEGDWIAFAHIKKET